MFAHTKRFKLLLPLLAFLLFAFQWIYNYVSVWYVNSPEETQYFTGNNMGFYMGYAYLFMLSFIVFVIAGIAYLVSQTPAKPLQYILLGDLSLAFFYAWHYSTTFKNFHGLGLLNFVVIALFALSMHHLSKPEAPIENLEG